MAQRNTIQRKDVNDSTNTISLIYKTKLGIRDTMICDSTVRINCKAYDKQGREILWEEYDTRDTNSFMRVKTNYSIMTIDEFSKKYNAYVDVLMYFCQTKNINNIYISIDSTWQSGVLEAVNLSIGHPTIEYYNRVIERKFFYYKTNTLQRIERFVVEKGYLKEHISLFYENSQKRVEYIKPNKETNKNIRGQAFRYTSWYADGQIQCDLSFYFKKIKQKYSWNTDISLKSIKTQNPLENITELRPNVYSEERGVNPYYPCSYANGKWFFSSLDGYSITGSFKNYRPIGKWIEKNTITKKQKITNFWYSTSSKKNQRFSIMSILIN